MVDGARQNLNGSSNHALFRDGFNWFAISGLALAAVIPYLSNMKQLPPVIMNL